MDNFLLELKKEIEKTSKLILKLKVRTKQKNNSFYKIQNSDLYQVSLKAVPVKGKANKELIKYLATKLNLSQDCFKIISGQKSKIKLISVIK